MKITYLIGNGFDINLGLDTRFSDFLKHYKTIDSGSNYVLEFFKERVLDDVELWANAEEAFGIATAKFKAEGLTAEDFCDCHENFCIELAKYLIKQEERIIFTSFEPIILGGFAKVLVDFSKTFEETERRQIDNAVLNFSGGFEMNFINFNYTSTLDSCIAISKKQPLLVGKRSLKGARYDNSINKVLHVHGTTYRNMVLGVNDVSQISDVSLFDNYDEEFMNEIIKQKTNEMNQDNMDEKVVKLLESSDLIYIYGMSIGLTDKLWWERICNLMKIKRNLHIIIHRYGTPKDTLIRRRNITFTNRIKKEFLEYGTLTDDEKNTLKERVHITGDDIFSGISNLVFKELNVEEDKELATV